MRSSDISELHCIFYYLVAKWRLNNFLNFKPCAVKLISLISTKLSYWSWIKQKHYWTCNLGVQLANLNPQNIQICFIPMQISWTNVICFRSISLRLQILQSKKLLAVNFSVPLCSQPPSNQTSSQSVPRNRRNLTQACLTKQILSANCTNFNCATNKQTCWQSSFLWRASFACKQLRSTEFIAASCYRARSQSEDSVGAVAEGETRPGIRSTSDALRLQYCFRRSSNPNSLWGKVYLQKKASDQLAPRICPR